MFDSITPETLGKIDGLCKKISVAHNLDEEIREELRCHIEDKLNGYLRGDETLTEDDAFILVSEHFGDPAVIKVLYQDVEAVAVRVSLARRLGAVFTVWLGTHIFFPIIALLCLKAYHISAGDSASDEEKFLMLVLIMCSEFFTTFLMFVFLKRWKTHLQSDQSPWFSTIKFKIWIPLIFLLLLLTPFIYQEMTANSVLLLSVRMPKILSIMSAYFRITMLINSSIICMIFLWWCDESPRRLLHMTWAFLVWLISTSYIIRLTHQVTYLTKKPLENILSNIISDMKIIHLEQNLTPGLLAVSIYILSKLYFHGRKKLITTKYQSILKSVISLRHEETESARGKSSR